MQPRLLVPVLLVLLMGLAAVPATGFSSSGIAARTPRERHTTVSMSAASAATTVDCGVIIAGAGPAGQSTVMLLSSWSVQSVPH